MRGALRVRARSMPRDSGVAGVEGPLPGACAITPTGVAHHLVHAGAHGDGAHAYAGRPEGGGCKREGARFGSSPIAWKFILRGSRCTCMESSRSTGGWPRALLAEVTVERLSDPLAAASVVDVRARLQVEGNKEAARVSPLLSSTQFRDELGGHGVSPSAQECDIDRVLKAT